MRSLGFEFPDEVMLDEYAVLVDVFIEIPGEDDENGNPGPPVRTYFIQDTPADVQPRSGGQRAQQSGTVYESTHVLYLSALEGWLATLSAPTDTSLPADTSWPACESAAVLIEAFFGHLAGTIPIGATVETKTTYGSVVARYTVVFIASWGTHLEIDLKAV